MRLALDFYGAPLARLQCDALSYRSFGAFDPFPSGGINLIWFAVAGLQDALPDIDGARGLGNEELRAPACAGFLSR